MVKAYRSILFLFLCIVLIFSVNMKVKAEESIIGETIVETTMSEESSVERMVTEEPTAEDENEKTIPAEETTAEDVNDGSIPSGQAGTGIGVLEKTVSEESSVEGIDIEEPTAEDVNDKTVSAGETETEADVEETIEETTVEKQAVQDKYDETKPEETTSGKEAEKEAVVEETPLLEGILAQVVIETESKPEMTHLEEKPEQTEEANSKVVLMGGSRPPGWSKDEYGNWYYYMENGDPYHGWLRWNGDWYYINAGYMCTGPTWVEDSSGQGCYWRLNDDGKLEEKAGWVDLYGLSWLYFDATGKGYDGWLSYNGCWYYIDRGVMWTGRVKIYDENTGLNEYWHFDDEGRLNTTTEWYLYQGRWFYRVGGKDHIGWLRYNNKWYFINEFSGKYTGIRDINYIRYDFDDNGALIEESGWVYFGDEWRYRDQDGSYHDGWLWDSGHWYLLDNGRVEKGLTKDRDGYYWRLRDSGELDEIAGWVQDLDEGKWYYFDSKGKGYDGWLRYNGHWYYISGGYMCTGPTLVEDSSGQVCYWRLNASGRLEEKAGWVEDLDDGDWYYFDSKGKGYDGWLRYNGKWYYFDRGLMYSRARVEEKSGYYWRFKSSGELEAKAGWVGYDEYDWLYFDSNGKGFDGWLFYNKKWYYIDKGFMLRKGFRNAGGKLHEFDDEGVWLRALKGWVKDKDGEYYYAHQDGTIPVGWFKYNNKWYYIHKHGRMASYSIYLDDKLFLFDSTGALASGWFRDRYGYQRYANSDGTIYLGWLQQGSKWYYSFYGFEQMVRDAYRINGTAHKFDRYGVWLAEIR